MQTRARERDQEMEKLKEALYKEKEDREKLLEKVREELQQKLVEKDEMMKEMIEHFQEELRQQRKFHKKRTRNESTDEGHSELENKSIIEGGRVRKNVHFSGDVDKSIDRRSKGSQTPDLEWDYGYRSLQGGVGNQNYGRQGGKFSSTPVEDDYFVPTFEESEVPNEYYCQNCQLTHQPPICPCPICLERGHTVIDCQQAGLLESSQEKVEVMTEPEWGTCKTCGIHHQGECPCKVCEGMGHSVTECPVLKQQQWRSNSVPRGKRDQVSPTRSRQETRGNQAFENKMGVVTVECPII